MIVGRFSLLNELSAYDIFSLQWVYWDVNVEVEKDLCLCRLTVC